MTTSAHSPRPSVRPSRRPSLAAVLVAVLVAVLAGLGVWVSPAASAITCPPAPWDCPALGGWESRGDTTSGEHVTVIGDSLIQNQRDVVADRLSANGFVSYTFGAGGYAYAHWNHGVAQGLDIGDYADRENADHVVIALGTNDGRLLAARPGVTQQLVADQILWGMTRADDESPGCVILVSPSTRSYPAATQQVRNVITLLTTARNNALGTTRFVVADWRPGTTLTRTSSPGTPRWPATARSAADRSAVRRPACPVECRALLRYLDVKIFRVPRTRPARGCGRMHAGDERDGS
jgi:lysophospholipase L1-like esterase